MALTNEEIIKQLASLRKVEKVQNSILGESQAYLANVKKLGMLQAEINHNLKSQADNARILVDLNDKLNLPGNSAARQAELNALIDGATTLNDILEEQIELQRVSSVELQHTIEQVNLLNVGFRATGKAWDKIPSASKEAYNWIKSMSALEMSKEIKQAELSMGILSNQSKFFSKTMSNASKSTIQIGVGVKDLAKSQAEYSESIGRSMMLSEGGYKALSQIAKGTSLGVEGAAQMAASMETFGISAEGSRDMIQETVDNAQMFGTNATKTIKGLGTAIKLADKYHFKGGVKGMADMAAYATKIGMDMDNVANMAEKVFRPEGAVEMAALMQTLGGDFARLGDPFQLMFKARNDFAGFSKDVGRAAAEFAQFNESSGEFDITGLQLDRMRELAKVTGLSEENLSKMAREGAKFNKIKSLVPSVLSDEDKDLVSSLSQFDKESGKWQLKVGDGMKFVEELTASDVTQRRGEKQSLEDRAKQAQTFDDAFNNLIEQFKTMGLPFIEALNEYLVDPLVGLQQYMNDSGFIDSAKELASNIGAIVGTVTKFIVEHPVASLIGYLTGKAFFSVPQWIANGKALAVGFNMGSIGGTGAKAMALKGGGMAGARMGALGGAMGGLAVGGMAAYSEYQGNKEQGMDSSENNWRTTMVGMGGGGGVLAGAAMGALGGPLAPITVPLGALIGAGLGVFAGNELGDAAYGNGNTQQVNDGIIKFNPQDKFMQMNDGLVASTDKGKIDDLVGGKGGGKGGGKIEFGDLTIKGEIVLKSSNGGIIDKNLLNDPFFIKEITQMIQEQLSMNISGGKLNPNPS